MRDNCRYEIVQSPDAIPLPSQMDNWCTVHDTERKVIIGLFPREVDAINYVTWREDWDRKMEARDG